MLAEALDVADLEPAGLQRGDHRPHLLELAVGEDEAVEERPDPAASRAGGDAVDEGPPLGPEQPVDGLAVAGHPTPSDVLDHPHAGHGVELAVEGVPVVGEPNLGPPLQARAGAAAGLAHSAWRGLAVIPSASTPQCSAAWKTRLPQPQPMSRSRSPGCRRSLRQTSSSFASWAVSRSVSGVAK